jgi:acetyl esterase/lipase
MTSTLFLLAALSVSADPSPTDISDVRVEKGVKYLPEGRKELADLYFPKEMTPGKKYPAVLIIHGGGFVGGKRDAARELNIGGVLARNGYIAMSIDYVLAAEGKPTWPQCLYDCKTAVRWLRANAAKLQIDPDHIGVIGGSAGGHLAAMVAITGPEAGLDPKEPYGDIPCRVNCAVPMYGSATLMGREKPLLLIGKSEQDAPEAYKQASPVTHLSKDDPPLLILHGTADKTVPVMQSEMLHKAAKEAGIVTELVIIEGAPHTFHLQPKERDLRPLVLGFFDKYLKPAK